MTNLDPRESRSDMTSRECAKIFGALIKILEGLGHELSDIRKSFGFLANISQGFSPKEKVDDRDVDMKLVSAIAGMIGGLLDLSDADSITDAIRWWSEKDEAWAMAEKPIPKGEN